MQVVEGETLTQWGTALGNVALGSSIVIAVLATSQWYRRRAHGTVWAALAFALLGAILVLGKVGSFQHAGWWVSPSFHKSLAGALLVIPYMFFLFTAAFRPPRWGIRVLAAALTVGVVALTLALHTFPASAESPATSVAYRLAVTCQLAYLFTFVVMRLWTYGGGRSSMAAIRMRLLAAAIAGLEIVVVAGAAGLSSHRNVALATQMFAVVMGALLTLVLPWFVRPWGNKREDDEFQRAVADLVTAESAEDVSTGMLPHVCALVGASGASLVDEDDNVIAHYGTAPSAPGRLARPDNTINVKSRFGPAHHLVVNVDPYMLYFGRGEMQRLEELADLAALATERCDAEAALTHQSLHDSLTGLPNRDLFIDRLSQALAVVERHSSVLAVMFIDLDRFKLINDRIDHAAGDAVLVEVARRLAVAVRDGDTVARIGGDEFVAVIEIDNQDDALMVADRMREGIGAPIDVGDRTLSVTASIGLVVTSDRTADPFSLLRDADAAMYLAKEAGRDHVQLFNEQTRTRSLERIDLERELAHAIGDGQLRLQFQPIFRLSDGVGVGVEALVRWEHPKRGMLSPDDFIPMAEATGVIIQLNAWVLVEACNQAARWLEFLPGDDPFTMWVNQSADQFHRTDVVATTLEILAKAGLDPRMLGVEITETVFMSDKERLRTTMSDLNWNGVSIAIDDFGTGFSSLSYLKRFPVDILKVDRSFVQGIGQEPETSLVEACLSLARSLDILTVAEGVESMEQADWLARAGCEHVQGYAYCRPVGADEALAVLIASRQTETRKSKFSTYRKLTRTAAAATAKSA
jgi:diguanylate cyclase (GGDEF)-like protein